LGTSGTIMGVAKALKEYKPDIKIVSAHPVKGHYIQGIKNIYYLEKTINLNQKN
jgi:cysteine synthase B